MAAPTPDETAVVLINAFEVEEGRDEEFLARWRETGDHLRHQDGYISTRLHRSLDPKARFRFVNVAVWRSPEDFQRAVSSDEFARLAGRMTFPANPALYEVVAE
jgi:heme oxygenase (mycobilin-producing)